MIKRQVKKVTLISGEGKADRNFLNYLKTLYCARDSGHVIHVYQNNAPGHAGGSSRDVIKETMLACCNYGRSYDAFVVILDRDICPTTDQGRLYSDAVNTLKPAFRTQIPGNFRFIFLDPCLEGFLLDIITASHPPLSFECKHKLQNIIGFDSANISAACFQQRFPEALLNQRKASLQPLSQLYELFHLANSREYEKWFRHSPSRS